MKLNSVIDPLNISDVKELARFCSTLLSDIQGIFNGNVGINDNVSCQVIFVNFQTANSQVTVPITLGRVPQSYIQCGSNVACRIYDGTSANTSSTIYLRSDTIAVVTVLVF